MAFTKRNKFPPDLQRVADLAKALSHPARLRILQILARYEISLCQEIVIELPLSQSTVSQHLKELREVGLIRYESDGPRVYYSIDVQALESARELLPGFLEHLARESMS